MPIMKKNRLLLVAIETTKGTELTPTVAVLAQDPEMVPELNMQDRAYASKTGGQQLPDFPGEQTAKLTFTADLLADGDGFGDGVAILLQGCGLKDSTGYKPQTDTANQKTITAWLYEGGRVKKMTGAMGEVKLTWNRGEIIKAEFEFMGVWGGVSAAAVPATALPATLPVNGTSATLDAYPALTKEIELVMGNELAFRGDHYVITSRSIEITMDPEAALVATYDFYGKMAATTSTALSLSATNGTATITLAVATAQIVEISDGDREGLAIDSVKLKALDSSTGDDAIVLAA